MRRDEDRLAVLRTFIAVELSHEVRRELDALQGRMRAVVPPDTVRWAAVNNLHLTLKFLGDTRPNQLHPIVDVLKQMAQTQEPFSVMVAGRGCFPNFRRPNVLWAGLHDRGEQLAQLADAIERAVAPLGWAPEDRGFRPHLTLGRVNQHVDSRQRAELGRAIEALEVGTLGTIEVYRVHFIRSDLRPEGPLYTVLARIPLGSADTDGSF